MPLEHETDLGSFKNDTNFSNNLVFLNGSVRVIFFIVNSNHGARFRCYLPHRYQHEKERGNGDLRQL